jgi:putative phosphoesterase
MRPEALAVLQDCDLILHAGDVGSGEILPILSEIAPVIAVKGNVDTEDWSRELAETIVIEIGTAKLCLTHDRARLSIDPAEEGCGVVVFGHSHKPQSETAEGVLWFNPGSAGPRRFRLPISIGKLCIQDGIVRPELIRLDLASVKEA